jgi:hypothetical protein
VIPNEQTCEEQLEQLWGIHSDQPRTLVLAKVQNLGVDALSYNHGKLIEAVRNVNDGDTRHVESDNSV